MCTTLALPVTWYSQLAYSHCYVAVVHQCISALLCYQLEMLLLVKILLFSSLGAGLLNQKDCGLNSEIKRLRIRDNYVVGGELAKEGMAVGLFRRVLV